MSVKRQPDPPVPGSPAWWVARSNRPRRASALTPEKIVHASIGLLDRGGLDNFAMRRLADVLGVATGALYRHFESRDAVLVAVHDELIAEVLEPEPDGDTWEERAASLTRRAFLAMRERPYLAVIWSSSEQLGPHALRAREGALQVALEGDLAPAIAARVYLTLLHFAIAFAVLEQNLASRADASREATERYFTALPEEQFPAIRALGNDLARTTIGEEFEFGLHALLAGLAATVSTVSPFDD